MNFFSKSPVEEEAGRMFERNARFNRYLDSKKNEIMPTYTLNTKKDQPMTEITLVGGAKVKIPTQFTYSKCRSCPASDLIWSITENGKKMPVHFSEKDKGMVSHFSDCPAAGEFRKEGKK